MQSDDFQIVKILMQNRNSLIDGEQAEGCAIGEGVGGAEAGWRD